nr:uncharacterized protein LOC113740964 [Coffea arabica]
MLAKVPDMEEVRLWVFAMDRESAAGPDGFTGRFFTFAWDVIAPDVHRAVVSFFCGSELPRFITSTSIALLPKVVNPQDFLKFRPISLCNFFNKLLSRILVGRLASVVSKIISPQQSGFVKGRTLTNNYLLAQELVSGIGKKTRGGNVALKLDMTKAYDRMSWWHIISMLRAFGFGESLIDLVWRLISNVWFSIIINGKSHGYFKSSRGLRQGDPLSPVLFIIGSEMLSRGLNALALQQGFIGFKVPPGCPVVTHLTFADDVLIIANGSTAALKRVMQVLEAYQLSSGQLVNAHKSGYLIHEALPPARRRVIERVTHFSRQWFRIHYLGFPLYTGRSKTVFFGEVCQAVLARIMSWKARLIFHGGRIILIKHVLSSIPVHLLSAAMGSIMSPGRGGGRGFQKAPRGILSFLLQIVVEFSSWLITVGRIYAGKVLQRSPSGLGGDEAARLADMEKNVKHKSEGGTIHGFNFKDFVASGVWDINRLGQHVPQELLHQILRHPVPSGESRDEVIWRLTASGRFTLASAFHDVRQAGNTSAQNKAFFEGTQMRVVKIFQDVMIEVKGVLEGKFKQRIGVHTFSQLYEWTNQSPHYSLQLVRWRAMGDSMLTLNTDGCSKGNLGESGGGGILHDVSGLPIFAFSASFGMTSSIRAEVLALGTGLRLCQQMGYAKVNIQVDSKVLVGILHRELDCPWMVRREVNQIWGMGVESEQVTHCYREANRVADCLANVGVVAGGLGVTVYDQFSAMPGLVRGEVRLDRAGIPSVRRRRVG